MSPEIPGIHHITALSGDPQATLDFYTRVLGLRLVKRTVNFDDPATHHLYLGDRVGAPGTILTLFPRGARARRGRIGTGQLRASAFAIPRGAIDFWRERLAAHGVAVSAPTSRLGEEVLTFRDPDGLAIELTAIASDRRAGRETPGVPAAHAISGLHAATLSLSDVAPTAELLTTILGFRHVADARDRLRLGIGAGGSGTIVDLLSEPDVPRGTMGAGTVHHIAFRTPDDATQLRVRDALTDAGCEVTPVMDRRYFRSIYFREPGGVLFEIATDGPGFTTDESLDDLGRSLMLPPWLEPSRAEIEERLPPVALPGHADR